MYHQAESIKRDLGSRVLRMGVNLHEIAGAKLDDTNKYKQRCMHENMGKRAKIQRNKESQTDGTKQARQA